LAAQNKADFVNGLSHLDEAREDPSDLIINIQYCLLFFWAHLKCSSTQPLIHWNNPQPIWYRHTF